jgi:hypothetical protein
MAKIEKHDNVKIGDPDVSFYCPGCKCDHGVWLQKDGYSGPAWGFNGDYDRPTFTPSIKVIFPFAGKVNICHSFVKDGMIEYLSDCTHELAGQTVELPEID